MSTTIYLYVKTHNKTGMKYFGKTINDDVEKYRGSGIEWNRHIEEHGYDVTTEIIAEFDNEDDARDFAIEFSEENMIVESDGWANIIPECASYKDNFIYVNELGLNNINNCSDESKERHLRGSTEGGIKTRDLRLGFHGFSDEQKSENGKKGVKALQEKLKKEYGYISVFSHLNKDEVFNKKRKEAFKRVKHQQGIKNSQYGKCWMKHSEMEMNKKVNKDDVDYYISLGWERGRKMGWPTHKE